MRQILVLAIFCISITSCQKDIEPLASGSGSGSGGTVTAPGAGTPATSGTITATIDGKVTTFNTAASAIRANVAGTNSIAIFGFQGAGGASDQISITINSSSGIIAAGNYLYDDITGKAFGSIGLVKFGDPSPFASFLSDSNPTRVVITSATSTAIAGTFSGDIFSFNLTTGLEGPKKVVKQGSFNVKIN